MKKVFFLLIALALDIYAYPQNKIHKIAQQQHWDDVPCNCDSMIKIAQKDPCKVLSLMADSTYIFTRLNSFCLYRLCRSYYTTTNIDHSAHLDGNDGFDYVNTSLGKSLYKMDILLWMRYYQCVDSTTLKSKKYGEFTLHERAYINVFLSNKDENFDTSILIR